MRMIRLLKLAKIGPGLSSLPQALHREPPSTGNSIVSDVDSDLKISKRAAQSQNLGWLILTSNGPLAFSKLSLSQADDVFLEMLKLTVTEALDLAARCGVERCGVMRCKV